MSEQKIPEMFTYVRPKLPDDCIHAISPSQIGKFFSYPRVWYDECYMGQESEFKGNTSTVTGTICHYIYNQVTLGKEITREQINKQLDEYMMIKPNPDVDVNQVKTDYPLVSAAVVNGYLLDANSKGCLIKSEEQVMCKVMDGIYLAGTCDRIEATANYFCSNEALRFLKENGLL